MRTVSVRLADLQKTAIPLGFMGENLHTRVIIDAKKVYDEYPHAAVSLTVRPPYGEPYPAIVVRDGDLVIWDVADSDLTRTGQGEIQLAFTQDEVVVKTWIAKTRIGRSIMPTGEIPEPLDDFLTRAGAAVTAIPETIDAAFEAITAEAETLTPGSGATASFDSETKKLTIGVPEGLKGDKGDQGIQGEQGIQGIQGPVGPQGVQGDPGYTPQRGVDYWTAADQAGMRQDIADDLQDARSAIAGDRRDALTAIGNAGSTQVGNVNTAGAAQMQAVEDKGDEVLESIPQDYSDLAGDVSDLKSAMNETMPSEETAQELLAYETYNTALTDSTLTVIGALFTNLPQDDTLTDILHSLELECERLNMIYDGWIAERSA